MKNKRLKEIIDRLDRKIKQYKYVHNLPSIRELFDFGMQRHPDSYVYYHSIVRTLEPILLKEQKIVLTKRGLGKIREIFIDEDERIERVTVEMMTRNYARSKGYVLMFRPHELYQYVVYHEPLKRHIMLSPKDYVYMVEEAQPITYRVTNLF